MRSLIYKEWLALFPYLGAVLLASLTFFLVHMLGDALLSGFESALSGQLDDWFVLEAALVFAIPHASIAREFRDGTIELLDGLPVTRSEIYWAKLLAALIPVVVLVAGMFVVKMIGLLILDDGTALSWGSTLFVHGWLFFAGLIGFFGAGLVLSWLGELGWGVLLLMVFAMGLMGWLVPSFRALSILNDYLKVTFQGSQIEYAAFAPWVWVIVGCTGALISWAMFLGPGDTFIKVGSKLLSKARILMWGAIGMILSLPALTSLGTLRSSSAELSIDARRARVGSTTVMYRAEAEENAQVIMRALPDIDRQVRRVFHIEQPMRFDLELLGTGAYHAGVFTGGKIRLAANAEPAVLAHELIHAYAHAASQQTTFIHSNAVRFFSEGLATYLEETLAGARHDAFRTWAGAIYQAEQHRFELLLDSAARGQRYDAFQDYPLGFVFVEVLVERYGREALVCLTKAMGDAGRRPVRGVGLWYGMFDRCGLDMERTVSDYEIRLEKYAADFPAPTLDLSARLERGPRGLGLRVSDDFEDLRCRFRTKANASPAEMEDRSVVNGVCPVPFAQQGELTLWYQLGQALPGGFVMFTPWISTPISRVPTSE